MSYTDVIIELAITRPNPPTREQRDRDLGYKIGRELLADNNLDEFGIAELAADGHPLSQGIFCAMAEYYAFRATVRRPDPFNRRPF